MRVETLEIKGRIQSVTSLTGRIHTKGISGCTQSSGSVAGAMTAESISEKYQCHVICAYICDSAFKERDPTVAEHVKQITKENIKGWQNKLDGDDIITNEAIADMIRRIFG